MGTTIIQLGASHKRHTKFKVSVVRHTKSQPAKKRYVCIHSKIQHIKPLLDDALPLLPPLTRLCFVLGRFRARRVLVRKLLPACLIFGFVILCCLSLTSVVVDFCRFLPSLDCLFASLASSWKVSVVIPNFDLFVESAACLHWCRRFIGSGDGGFIFLVFKLSGRGEGVAVWRGLWWFDGGGGIWDGDRMTSPMVFFYFKWRLLGLGVWLQHWRWR